MSGEALKDFAVKVLFSLLPGCFVLGMLVASDDAVHKIIAVVLSIGIACALIPLAIVLYRNRRG